MAQQSIWKRWEVMTLLFIIVVSLVIAGGYAAYGALSKTQNPVDIGPRVQAGDDISVNYVGMFEDGRVFDTSIQSVAENDTLYPKSLSFSSSPPFNPMTFTVGGGQMIQGFDNGVIGMGINQTRVLTIHPEEGYGQPDENLIKTASLIRSVPVYEWVINATVFKGIYSADPYVGTTVVNQIYGWDMTVFYVDQYSGKIMLKNEPTFGEIVSFSDAWDSKVVSIDETANNGDGEIVIRHLLGPEDSGNLSGTDSGGTFIITHVNLEDNTYVKDYNREVVGNTLIFKVTVLSIQPSES